jgi:proteasome lid subunit RPN8/RPN11
VLARIVALAESDPEREVCGFVVRLGDGELAVAPMRNALGDPDAPPGLPSSPSRGYLVDPREQLRLFGRLRRDGGQLVAAYHSHVDGAATFSAVDREQALVDGRPVLPGTDHVVLGLGGGRVREIQRFWWDGNDFASESMQVPVARDAARHAP